MKLTGDELEFALSQYHDGTLNPVERASIDEILATDASARATLAEIAKLDALVKRASATPEIAWDKFRASVSRSLEAVEAPAATTFKIGAWTRIVGAAVAVAAAIAIVVNVSLRERAANQTTGGPRVVEVSVGPAGTSGTSTATVEIGTSTVAKTADVSVGPSPQMAYTGWQYEASFLERPSRVVIAVSPEPAQDGSSGSQGPF